ncbi:MAG: class I SAM-dependent methyltransferase [Chloroflexi bacterium]|nr:class I SAM-dependent methyltransferase [Chloroflexota bacterium]
MSQPDDISRLRAEYEDRKKRFANSDVYSSFNVANLFAIQQRQRDILASLKRAGVTGLADKRILEMGCGGGGVLAEFLTYGARPQNLFGVDILRDRLAAARGRLSGSHFANADGSHLPFHPASFDIVMQFTALSSILDPDLRRDICRDMLRVLRPSGLILWYDFWLNPTNPQTRGIRPAEIKRLFPGCQYEFHKITLAPPIARKLVPVSWILALFLENLKIFNTHYLVAIRPEREIFEEKKAAQLF